MPTMLLKIGELAKRTGLTVRTLHHYDSIGLLTPSVRSDAAYRLYNREDIVKLHRIQALRCLDLSLAEIAGLLQGGSSDLQSVIEQQIVGLERQIERSVELRDRLRRLAQQLREQRELSMDYWLSTLEMMNMYGKYFTQEELEGLAKRKAANAADPDLSMLPIVAAMRHLMDSGISPRSAQAQELAARWRQIMRGIMGDDPRMFVKLNRMHREEPSVQALTGVDDEMIVYVTAALTEIRYQIFREYMSEEELRNFRDGHIKNADRWMASFASLRNFMEQKLPVEHPEVQALTVEWMELAKQCWGDDSATLAKARKIMDERPEVNGEEGLTPEMRAYLVKAIEYCKQSMTSERV